MKSFHKTNWSTVRLIASTTLVVNSTKMRTPPYSYLGSVSDFKAATLAFEHKSLTVTSPLTHVAFKYSQPAEPFSEVTENPWFSIIAYPVEQHADECTTHSTWTILARNLAILKTLLTEGFHPSAL